jgi:cell division transport system ATP-binding protein
MATDWESPGKRPVNFLMDSALGSASTSHISLIFAKNLRYVTGNYVLGLNSVIVLNGVSKTYYGGNRVLDRLQLELKKGEFLYVLGGSGAGKSSLLRILATEEAPTQGSLSMFGYDLSQAAPTTLRAIRQVLGYVPQEVRLISDLSVYDNVALALTTSGRRANTAENRNKIHELLERLGLIQKRHKPAIELSGGEAQRVAVARALARAPELIIADEPTGAQDRDYTWSMMDLILRANVTGATVVVATHDRELVKRVKKRCAILRNGNLSFEEAACYY